MQVATGSWCLGSCLPPLPSSFVPILLLPGPCPICKKPCLESAEPTRTRSHVFDSWFAPWPTSWKLSESMFSGSAETSWKYPSWPHHAVFSLIVSPSPVARGWLWDSTGKRKRKSALLFSENLVSVMKHCLNKVVFGIYSHFICRGKPTLKKMFSFSLETFVIYSLKEQCNIRKWNDFHCQCVSSPLNKLSGMSQPWFPFGILPFSGCSISPATGKLMADSAPSEMALTH